MASQEQGAVTAAPRVIDMSVLVRPRQGADPRLEIEITAKSDNLPRRWVVQKVWAGDEVVLNHLDTMSALCDGKVVRLTEDDLETHVGWATPHRCHEATLRYTVHAPKPKLTWGYEFDVVVTPKLATAIAETAMVLPDCPDDTRTRIEVAFDLAEMPGAEGVYSLGPGVHDTTTRAARHAYLAAGRFVTIRHDAENLSLEARFPEGTSLDVPAASRDLLKLLAAESKIFGDEKKETLRMLVVGMPAADGGSHGTSLTGSAALWIDSGAKWNEEHARLAAHEMFHLYNGQIIRRTGPDAQTYWFSEGFTEHYTDEMMLRAKIFRPHDWFESVRYRLRKYHAHPDAETPNEKAEMHWGGSAVQLPYLRGSMIAAYADATLRKKSGNKRTLDDFMRALVARARADQPPLGITDMLDLLSEELGSEASEIVKRVAIDGQRIELPADTFGSCVEVIGSGKTTDLRIKPGVDLDKCMATGR